MSIPNMLSILRILLIPVFIFTYFTYKDVNVYIPVGVLLFSGFTDILDGYIARKYSLITQFGKIIDPTADKLTIAAVMVCLAITYNHIMSFLIIYIIKELFMLIGSILAVKNGVRIESAKWYGKFTTVFLYAVILIIMLIKTPTEGLLYTLNFLSIVIVVVCYILYALEYYKLYKIKNNKKKDT